LARATAGYITESVEKKKKESDFPMCVIVVELQYCVVVVEFNFEHPCILTSESSADTPSSCESAFAAMPYLPTKGGLVHSNRQAIDPLFRQRAGVVEDWLCRIDALLFMTQSPVLKMQMYVVSPLSNSLETPYILNMMTVPPSAPPDVGECADQLLRSENHVCMPLSVCSTVTP
jgi:hypothetical protein